MRSILAFYCEKSEDELIGKKRASYDLVAEIVETCVTPTKKYTLFHTIRTSYARLDRWLQVAVDLKLIQRIGENYLTTKKGTRFLEAWRNFQATLREE